MLDCEVAKGIDDILFQEVIRRDMGTNQRQNEESHDDEQAAHRQPILAEAPSGILPQVALRASEDAAVVKNARDFAAAFASAHCTLTRGSSMG